MTTTKNAAKLSIEKMNLTSTVPTGTPSTAKWMIKANGRVAGFVERATITTDPNGAAQYLAHVLKADGSTKLIDRVFGGEFGNVDAVSAVLNGR
jgi:hypothetical protein